MKWNEIQGLISVSGRSPDFDAWLEVFPQLRRAVTTPQSAPHHHYAP